MRQNRAYFELSKAYLLGEFNFFVQMLQRLVNTVLLVSKKCADGRSH